MSTRLKLNRRLNRRLNQFATLRLSGRRPSRARDLLRALSAFDRAIRAHKRVIKLAPELFDPVLVHQEKRRREEDEKLRQMFEPALRKAYGDEAVDKTPWPSPPAIAVPPRTRAAIDRAFAECNSWLNIGSGFLKTFQERQPHYVPSFSHIARLIEVAFTLGRLACGLPLDGRQLPPAPESPPSSDFLAALERIYGKSSSQQELGHDEHRGRTSHCRPGTAPGDRDKLPL